MSQREKVNAFFRVLSVIVHSPGSDCVRILECRKLAAIAPVGDRQGECFRSGIYLSGADTVFDDVLSHAPTSSTYAV